MLPVNVSPGAGEMSCLSVGLCTQYTTPRQAIAVSLAVLTLVDRRCGPLPLELHCRCGPVESWPVSLHTVFVVQWPHGD